MLNFRSLTELWGESIRLMNSPPEGLKLPWWPNLTRMMGGLRTNEITLLCAPTGAGKTQLLANLAAQLLIAKVPLFAAPVETGDADFLIRVLSAIEGKDYHNGDPVSEEELGRMTNKIGPVIADSPFYLSTHDNRVEIEEMITTLKYMNQHNGVKVALLDNLNFFLKVTSSTMERAEMDNAMHEFVMLAKKLPIHIILVCHPRKTDGEGRVESEFDIKGSSLAVQEASNVLLFNRPIRQEVKDSIRLMTDRELVFKKLRKRGQNVNKPVWLRFDSGTFMEYR